MSEDEEVEMGESQVLTDEDIKTTWTRGPGGVQTMQVDPDATDPDSTDSDGTDGDAGTDADGTDTEGTDADTKDS